MKQSTTQRINREGNHLRSRTLRAPGRVHPVALRCPRGVAHRVCRIPARGAAADTCWSVSRCRVDLAVCSPTAPTRTKLEVPPQLLHGAAAWSPCGIPVAVLSLSLALSPSRSHSLTRSLTAAHAQPHGFSAGAKSSGSRDRVAKRATTASTAQLPSAPGSSVAQRMHGPV